MDECIDKGCIYCVYVCVCVCVCVCVYVCVCVCLVFTQTHSMGGSAALDSSEDLL